MYSLFIIVVYFKFWAGDPLHLCSCIPHHDAKWVLHSGTDAVQQAFFTSMSLKTVANNGSTGYICGSAEPVWRFCFYLPELQLLVPGGETDTLPWLTSVSCGIIVLSSFVRQFMALRKRYFFRHPPLSLLVGTEFSAYSAEIAVSSSDQSSKRLRPWMLLFWAFIYRRF